MQIAVKFVNFPKPGSKWGSLKLQDGNSIIVPQDLLPQFRAGMVCEIATRQQTWGDGPVTIAASGPMAPGTVVQPPYEGVQQQYGQPYQPPSVSRETNQRANAGFQPRVYQGGRGAPAQAPRSPDQERQIFVTGVVGRAMGSGKFTASEIPVLAQAAAEAWDRVMAQPQPKPWDGQAGTPMLGAGPMEPSPPQPAGDPLPNDDVPF